MHVALHQTSIALPTEHDLTATVFARLPSMHTFYPVTSSDRLYSHALNIDVETTRHVVCSSDGDIPVRSNIPLQAPNRQRSLHPADNAPCSWSKQRPGVPRDSSTSQHVTPKPPGSRGDTHRTPPLSSASLLHYHPFYAPPGST